MLDLLFNPWVITIIVVCVIVGNIAALKQTADLQMNLRKKKTDLDKLNELDKRKQANANNQEPREDSER
ncbi:Protein of unknown function [Vibrio xiamenensis]|uniref:DUF2897 family protein n=1 Tax=Vibrio xiamenensis TaxID=861298 RepID=A0A1G8CZX5_9VIBR|nr:DUF2897 family protein [Vibrio xiamenensis]SDH51088.1 Protein of unknown function [Vibrio xiamenensis]